MEKEKSMTDISSLSEHDNLFKFLEAQDKAERQKEYFFTCPLCGGVAFWRRAKENNHLYTRCQSCGFRLIQ